MNLPIQAKFGYLAAMKDRPISVSGYPDLENLTYDWHRMPVRNARDLPAATSLKDNGFTSLPHHTGIADFMNGNDWQDAFAAEIVDVVKQATGASEVIVPSYSASVRSTKLVGSNGPAHFCHNDFTPGSTARHIAALDPELADARLSRRFAAYNLWRLISPPPQNQPLALCAAPSVQASDFVPGEARYMTGDGPAVWGEIACFRYNADHRWYYYPDLASDEILIWCGFDSDPNFASIVPHTAIMNPDCPADTSARTNVECRCYALFD